MSRGGPEETDGREQGCLIFYLSGLSFAAANIRFTLVAWSPCRFHFLDLRSSHCCTDPVPPCSIWREASGSSVSPWDRGAYGLSVLPCRMCGLLVGVREREGEKRGMGAFLSPDELAGTIRAKMQKNYGLLRKLDIRFNDLQKNMKKKMKKSKIKSGKKGKKEAEKQRGHEMQDVRNDSVASDALVLEHSNRIASIQKECLTVAEGKLALAVQTYELIDSHIQKLDMNNFLFEEERKRDTGREATGGADYLDYNLDARLQEAGNDSKSFFDDDDERRYCYCNQFPYGEMIACDGPECALEWFHFDCVGMKETPEGQWFCSECLDWKHQLGK